MPKEQVPWAHGQDPWASPVSPVVVPQASMTTAAPCVPVEPAAEDYWEPVQLRSSTDLFSESIAKCKKKMGQDDEWVNFVRGFHRLLPEAAAEQNDHVLENIGV